MLGRILPMLNKYVPAALATKGLGKINPKLEKFIGSSVASGYTIDAALDFLRNKFEAPANTSERQRLAQGGASLRPDERASLQTMRQSEQLPNAIQNVASLAGGLGGGLASLLGGRGEEESPTQPGQAAQGQQMQGGNPFDLISQYSPEIAQALQKLINSGRDPRESAAYLKNNNFPQFTGYIQSIEQDTGLAFDDWIDTLFGGKVQPKQQEVRQQTQPLQGQPLQNQAGGKRAGILQGIAELNQTLAALQKR